MRSQDSAPSGPGRRAPGPHASKPLIGDALRRCTAAFTAAAAHTPATTVAELVDTAARLSSASRSGNLAALVSDTIRDVSGASKRDRSVSELESVALAAFDAVVECDDDHDLDVVISDLVAAGIDGERLAWAVITVESVKHIPLVRKEAHKAARVWERQAEDLETYAWRGLRLALRGYSPAKWMFSTYACPKIRGAIHDGVRSERHLPKRLLTFVNKVETERDLLHDALGRNPTLEELATSLDVELEKLTSMAHLATPSSLDESTEEGVGRQIAGDIDVNETVETTLRDEAIREALLSIDADDAAVVQMLVVEGCSYAEARRRTGMSQRQLRSRKERGLADLADALADWQ